MKFHRLVLGVIGLWVSSLDTALHAELFIEETFTGYLDNALISASPAGPALGLTGDWTLEPLGDFFVNRTLATYDAGTGKAVYNRPFGFDGTRAATRSTSTDHVIFENDGDVFYASFLIDPGLASGEMTFKLGLTSLDGGEAPDFLFGIMNGQYVVGNNRHVEIIVGGGTVTADEQLALVRVEYGAADSGPDDSEVISLWVDPVNESSMPVIDGVLTDILNRGGGKISDVSMRADWMYGYPSFFDNLRVGSSFAEVVPEPLRLPGDFDRDGIVDGRDFLVWQRDPSIGDLADWQANYGNDVPASIAIPEPGTFTLAMFFLILSRRR